MKILAIQVSGFINMTFPIGTVKHTKSNNKSTQIAGSPDGVAEALTEALKKTFNDIELHGGMVLPSDIIDLIENEGVVDDNGWPFDVHFDGDNGSISLTLEKIPFLTAI
jgi:hypothetical protein